MILFDYLSFNPWDELQTALHRVPSTEFSKGSSLKGRIVCVWKVCYHTAAIVVKPVVYAILSLVIVANKFFIAQLAQKVHFSFQDMDVKILLAGVVAPLGQIMQLFKAIMGILHPGFYFKEDELDLYFNQLSQIAEEVGCDSELINLLKESPSIIFQKIQLSPSRMYYQALISHDLAIICEKFQQPNLSQNEKIAILNMFAPLPSDPRQSGVQACPPGLGRLLEQICACLDVPQNPKKVVPWLVALFKEEILHQIVMQIEEGKYIQIFPDGIENSLKHDAAHFGNFLILLLGEKIGLPQEMLEKASEDMMANCVVLSEDEKQELLELFNTLYTEEALENYLMERINSQPDGSPGLKDFRNYVIQTLAEQISDEEVEASKKDVQDRLGIGESLADDPVFYVKLHYFLYPDANPADENSSDLNQKGIKAFAATLDNDPFTYFISKTMDQEITSV